MNLRNMTTLGTRLLVAVLCLNAFLALPARAQDEYYPITDLRDWGANSSNCAMEVSNHFEPTCGLYSFVPLQQEGTNDPLFCNNECKKCCDSFDQTTDGDFFLVDSVCRCAQNFVLTGGVGIYGCVAPTAINGAFAAGLIDEETRQILMEVQQLVVLGTLGANVMNGSYLWGQGALTTALKGVLVGAQQDYIERIARGIMAMTRLGVMVMDVCGAVNEEYEEFAIEACKSSCNRWYPDPPVPEPQPNPEGPATSGPGPEVQNNVVPEPDGSGGGWGDIAPDGTVTWTEDFGFVTWTEGFGDPPLL